MEQKYNLKKSVSLNSMHDQKIYQIEIISNKVVFHFTRLFLYETNSKVAQRYSEKHKNFSSCDVVFTNVEIASVEVRTEKDSKIYGNVYDIEEFIEFICKMNYVVEIIEFYHGYGSLIIYGSLLNKEGFYCEDCIIKIFADKVIYSWK